MDKLLLAVFTLVLCAGMIALMGWLTALAVNFLFGTGWTFWHGVVAWIAISIVGGLLRRSRS